MSDYTIKDSGAREEYASGMVRDTAEGKINYALVADGPMLERWAEHLTKGAKKYAVRNWMKATGSAERERFRESAFRHFMEWYYGEQDEDHAAAVFFNINGAEYVDTGGIDPTITELVEEGSSLFDEVMWGAPLPHEPHQEWTDNPKAWVVD